MDKSKWYGLGFGGGLIAIAAVLLILKVPFLDLKVFYFVLGIALIIAGMPFFVGLLAESKKEKDTGQMFLEFSRDLVDGVKSGTPISKSIINVRNKDYGVLNPHIQKLANQISMGIPVKYALDTFAKDVNTSVVSRAVSLIREAETSGGKIETILESVAFSIAQIEKLKKERKAAVYNLIVQGYIIFLIFIAIMLVMQFKIIPLIGNLDINSNINAQSLSDINVANNLGLNNKGLDPAEFSMVFLFLLLTQGFFAGLIVGKISEGTVRAGFKHSFILVLLSWLLSSGANLFLNAKPM
jgi:flagellar protein FlaJ